MTSNHFTFLTTFARTDAVEQVLCNQLPSLPILAEKSIRSTVVANCPICDKIAASQSCSERHKVHFLRQIVHSLSQTVKQRLRQWTQPKYHTMCSIGIVQEDRKIAF